MEVNNMNKKRKIAADFVSEYKKLKHEKEIVTDQMYCSAELYRELARSEGTDGNQKILNEYKSSLERRINELNARRGAIQLRMKLIDSMILRLSDVEQLIIRRYYIDGESKGAADDIMEILSYEKTHVYRLKDKALDNIYDMMNSFPEDCLNTKTCD
jgi:hypothetical protein